MTIYTFDNIHVDVEKDKSREDRIKLLKEGMN
jgi:hypothetical protein